MVAVKRMIEIELPTLDAKKLAAMCRASDTDGCCISWWPLARCPLMAGSCYDTKAEDWKDFLSGVEPIDA